MKTKNTSISEIKWFVPLELSHSSYIYTAIVEFCKSEGIKFSLSSRNLNYRGRLSMDSGTEKLSNHFNTKITWVQLKYYTGKKTMLAFDLNDNPNHFGAYALKNADVYYKRCFQKRITHSLSKDFIHKIKPMGLPFMVRPNQFRFKNKLRFLFYKFKAIEILKLDRLILKRTKLYKTKAVNHFNSFVNTRTLDAFESYETNVPGNIFYQKRLFMDDTLDVALLNQQRVRIVKLLKENFPNYFLGGLQKNETSVNGYPSLISNISGDQQSFLAAMKKCGICIYTKGLSESPGWTLPEYLSQGKCIVAENLANELPYSLINEKHLVYFSDEKELLDICKKLLEDKKLREYLGNNARKYYENHIAPSLFFQNLLKDLN